MRRFLLPLAFALSACGSTPPAVSPPREPAPSPAKASPIVADLSVDVALAPGDAYRVFTDEIHLWWDHHFKEHPYHLRMEARPGGRFVELFDGEGNGAEHARVIVAEAGKMLRFVGPMGLSGKAVEFVHTLSFDPIEGKGTRVSLHLEVIGDLDEETRAVVRQVWEHFLGQYRSHVASRKPNEGPVSFLQQPVLAPEKVGLGFFSHASRGKARNHVHADDFELDTPARLSGLRFWGHVEGQRAPDLANISDFLVRIHGATPEGAPGPVLHEQFFSIERSGPRPTGRRAGTKEKPGAIEYVHEVTFATPLPLDARKTYFVSIAAYRKTSDGEPWQWSDAETRNARSYSHPLEDPAWKAIDDTDSAFELLFSR